MEDLTGRNRSNKMRKSNNLKTIMLPLITIMVLIPVLTV